MARNDMIKFQYVLDWSRPDTDRTLYIERDQIQSIEDDNEWGNGGSYLRTKTGGGRYTMRVSPEDLYQYIMTGRFPQQRPGVEING